MHALPGVKNIAAFQAWRADASQWSAGGARHRARPWIAACATPHLFSTGTNLVVGLDGPVHPEDFSAAAARVNSYRSVLRCRSFAGRLDVPIPEIVLEGERDAVALSRHHPAAGIIGNEAWPTLPEDQKERVLGQIGETIAEVQRVPLGELVSISSRAGMQFMRGQIEGCRARHERLGLPQKYLDGLDELLARRGTR